MGITVMAKFILLRIRLYQTTFPDFGTILIIIMHPHFFSLQQFLRMYMKIEK